jgi:hypothetical protein
MLSAGQNGELHEQSRQSPPQQGRGNQRQARKHPDPNATEGLRTEFRSRLPETEKVSAVLLKLNETSLSQLRRDHETGHLEHKITNAPK